MSGIFLKFAWLHEWNFILINKIEGVSHVVSVIKSKESVWLYYPLNIF